MGRKNTIPQTDRAMMVLAWRKGESGFDKREPSHQTPMEVVRTPPERANRVRVVKKKVFINVEWGVCNGGTSTFQDECRDAVSTATREIPYAVPNTKDAHGVHDTNTTNGN